MQGQTIRVLLADDSAVIRRLLTEALASDAEMEMVAAVRNGAEAVKAVLVCNPDIVLLDVEMPVMDGVEAVVAIRKLKPQIPIIMFSSITTQGGEATFDSLEAGANDFVTKPAQIGHLGDSLKYIREELLPKVKMWGRRSHSQPEKEIDRRASTRIGRVPLMYAPVNPVRKFRFRPEGGPVEMIAIGASTGGPDALVEIFKALPADFAVPIVIAQHMPPVFTQLLAARLSKTCHLRVSEGIDGAVIHRGDVWIAPGDFHMTVKNVGLEFIIRLDQSERENSCRPAVDPLFRSVATVYGSRGLGVVLSGMGYDGTKGCSAIKKAGGRVIVQDEATSIVWGMPRSVAVAGHADRVLPLKEITAEIIESVQDAPQSVTADRMPRSSQ